MVHSLFSFTQNNQEDQRAVVVIVWYKNYEWIMKWNTATIALFSLLSLDQTVTADSSWNLILTAKWGRNLKISECTKWSHCSTISSSSTHDWEVLSKVSQMSWNEQHVRKSILRDFTVCAQREITHFGKNKENEQRGCSVDLRIRTFISSVRLGVFACLQHFLGSLVKHS